MKYVARISSILIFLYAINVKAVPIIGSSFYISGSAGYNVTCNNYTIKLYGPLSVSNGYSYHVDAGYFLSKGVAIEFGVSYYNKLDALWDIERFDNQNYGPLNPSTTQINCTAFNLGALYELVDMGGFSVYAKTSMGRARVNCLETKITKQSDANIVHVTGQESTDWWWIVRSGVGLTLPIASDLVRLDLFCGFKYIPINKLTTLNYKENQSYITKDIPCKIITGDITLGLRIGL